MLKLIAHATAGDIFNRGTVMTEIKILNVIIVMIVVCHAFMALGQSFIIGPITYT